MKNSNSLSKRENEYRNFVVTNIHKSQQTFDKVLLSLASGALGVSISFINNIIDVHLSYLKFLLYFSWISWVISLILLLFSHKISSKAWEKTLEQIDKRTIRKSISKIGEPFSSRVESCNNFGLVFFILGLILFMAFLYINIEGIQI